MAESGVTKMKKGAYQTCSRSPQSSSCFHSQLQSTRVVPNPSEYYAIYRTQADLLALGRAWWEWRPMPSFQSLMTSSSRSMCHHDQASCLPSCPSENLPWWLVKGGVDWADQRNQTEPNFQGSPGITISIWFGFY